MTADTNETQKTNDDVAQALRDLICEACRVDPMTIDMSAVARLTDSLVHLLTFQQGPGW